MVPGLSGCAGTRPGSAFADVKLLVHDRTGRDLALPHGTQEQRGIEAQVAALVKQPLTPGKAVQLAFINNKRLRATLQELDLSQADLAIAGQWRNPSLAASLRFPGGGGTSNSEFGLSGEVLDWLLTPLRRKMALREYEAAKKRVSHEALDLAAEVKAAFYEVQARQQFLHKMETAAEVNNVTSDIADRLHKAGNITALDLLQEQTNAQQAALDLQRAKADLRGAREKLSRLAGLNSAEAARWSVTAELPAPAGEPSTSALEVLALKQRQDLAAQRDTVAGFEQALSLQKKPRLIPGLKLGVDTEREVDGSRVTGPTLDVEVPLFNWGGARLSKAGAELAQAKATLEALQSEVAGDVRTAAAEVQAARGAYDLLAKNLLPQRRKILAETLLQYNAMQVSNFVLLRAKEDEVKAERETIDALRTYWTARAQLEKAVGGSLR